MTDENEPDDLPSSPKDEATRTRLEHDVYLKAVNNPTRRRLLEIVFKSPLPYEVIAAQLVQEGLLQDEGHMKYHVDVLVKAKCIEFVHDDTPRGATIVKITQAGKVVDFLL